MKFFKIELFAVLVAAIFILSGCKPSKDLVKVTTTKKTIRVKADSSIRYNLDGSVALATTWQDEIENSSSRAAYRAADDEQAGDAFSTATKSLRKITDDDKEEDVISVKSLTDADKKEIGKTIAEIQNALKDDSEKDSKTLLEEVYKDYDFEVKEETSTKFVEYKEGEPTELVEFVEDPDVIEIEPGFQMQPVREVYQSPYTDIYEEAKGVYIAYAKYAKWKFLNSKGEYVDDALFGALVYVQSDGNAADIFVDSKGCEPNYQLMPAYSMKSSDDEDYLQFDQAGNMFVAAYDESKYDKTKNRSPISIYKYEPIGGTLSNVLPAALYDIEIRNYRVSEDGKWLFLNAMLNGCNNVYAIPTFRPEDYFALYSNPVEQWSIENLVVTSDRTVYFFVNDYAGGRRTSGLYKCKFDFANNTYSPDFIENETTLPMWAFEKDLGNDYTKEGKIDYEGLLNFIFSFCGDGKASDKVFRLDKAFAPYSDKTEDGVYDWWYGRLYTELTDIDALKFIFENENDSEAWDIFKGYCYDDTRSDDGAYRGGRGRFPFERFVFKKDASGKAIDETAYTVSPAYYNTEFGSTDTTGGILLSNNEGVFVLKPDHWGWGEDKDWFDCSYVVKVVDNNGNYVFETPDALKHFECPPPSKEYTYIDPTKPNWYKKPFQTNKDGIFLYNKARNQIWYYSDNVAMNLLANDDAAIESIKSFYADDDSITFIASYNNKTFTHKIDLKTRELKEYQLSGDLAQIIEVNSTGSKAKKDTSAGVSIVFKKIEDLTVADPIINGDGTITIKAAKSFTDENGQKEFFSNYRWTCNEKVLNLKDDGSVDGTAWSIDIDPTDYARGSYPILVRAKKGVDDDSDTSNAAGNNMYCSCFFYLIIE